MSTLENEVRPSSSDTAVANQTTKYASYHERPASESPTTFYLPAESVDEHTQGLVLQLRDAINLAYQSQDALIRCEASLVSTLESLNEVHLDLRTCEEALNLERQRHNETTELLGRVFREAVRSGDIADGLARRLAELRSSSWGIAQPAPQRVVSAENAEGVFNLAPPEVLNLSTQRQSSARDGSGGSFPDREDPQQTAVHAQPSNSTPSTTEGG
ncbi:hypothetical protein ACEPPN_006483 [Leptodophora sp. 'Broadleaf-Isolate-01']